MVAPGCTKRLPPSGSTRPAAILSSVDLPQPLRPIRQTRSLSDTDNSTPDNSGAPPKVSAMSFSWISGGAIGFGSTLVGPRLVGPLTLDRADGLVKGGKERGAVTRRKRSGAAGDFTGRAQIR